MSHRRDDAEEISNGLAERIEAVLDALNPGWVAHKGRAYLTAKSPKALGSFTVNLAGQYRGTWHRFSQDIGGGPLKLIAYILGGGSGEPTKTDFVRAFGWARDFLGMEGARPETDAERADRERKTTAAKAAAASKREADERKEAARRARRATTAAGIWEEGELLAGSLGERYLVGRGIPPVSAWPWAPQDTIRFHPELEWESGAEWAKDPVSGRTVKVKAGPSFPAIIARVQDAFGTTTAIWQIYLSADGGKANLSPNKVGRGPSAGGAIRIGGEDEHIGIAEGLETALSIWVLHGYRFPIWSGMSTSYVSFDPPIVVKEVSVFPDGDESKLDKGGRPGCPPGIRAAYGLRDRLKPLGLKVAVNQPICLGDGNDFLKAWGGDL